MVAPVIVRNTAVTFHPDELDLVPFVRTDGEAQGCFASTERYFQYRATDGMIGSP